MFISYSVKFYMKHLTQQFIPLYTYSSRSGVRDDGILVGIRGENGVDVRAEVSVVNETTSVINLVFLYQLLNFIFSKSEI